MDRRFSNIFPGLTEERAIELLTMPLDQMEDTSDRYIAASHLVNFPTERSIAALISALENQNQELDHRIARRKAIETLGRLKATAGLSAIRACLAEDDIYTVENAVWAIGEIGTADEEILEEIAQLLQKPRHTHRVIIHVLAKLDYRAGQERIAALMESEDASVASAALSAISRFRGDRSLMEQVVEFLQHSNVNVRRGSIQDLMDANYYEAIPKIATCPVSMVFRMRGIRHLAEAGTSSGAIQFEDIEPSLDLVIRDRPSDLELVHEYDQTPSLEFVVGELYQTDFGRCYLASKTILDLYKDAAPEALIDTFVEKAHNDYGAHYHVIKLFGLLQYLPAYKLLVEALHNKRPQFQKSRTAAAIALGNLGDRQAIPELTASLESGIWQLRYASLMALEDLGAGGESDRLADDPDWLVRAKATISSPCGKS